MLGDADQLWTLLWRALKKLMNRKIVYAAIVGAVLFALGMALQMFANQGELRIILFFVTLFIVGVVATGVKRSFLLRFVLSLALTLVNIAVLAPETFRALSNASVAAAFILLALINSAIGEALSAAGGFLSKRLFK